MFDDLQIDILRARLRALRERDRLPLVIELAQQLSHRHAARARPGQPHPGADLTEAIALLREARQHLPATDPRRAHVTSALGVLLGTWAIGGGRETERDEAIDCLGEGLAGAEHSSRAPAPNPAASSTVDTTLLYSAVLLIARAIAGDDAELTRATVAAPAILSQGGLGLRIADLDEAVSRLERLTRTTSSHHPEHQLAVQLLAQATVIRGLFAGTGFAGMMANLQQLMGLWRQPSACYRSDSPGRQAMP